MSAPIPAGWYPDPSVASSPQAAAGQLRWWDGAQWTEHLRTPDGTPPVAVAPATTAAGSASASAANASAAATGSTGGTQTIPGSEYGGRAGFGSAPLPPADEPRQQAPYPSASAQAGTAQPTATGFVNEVAQPGYHQPASQPTQQGGYGRPGSQQTAQPQSYQPQGYQQQGYQQQGPQQQGQPAPPQQGYQQYGGQPGHGRSPYTENVMAVSQKRKLIELTNEYDIYGADGVIIGRVVEVGQSGLKKAARFLTSLDQFMTHTLEVRDSAGTLIFTLTRPAKVMKSSVVVVHPNGAEMGRLVQQNVFGKIRFSMESGGRQVGQLSAENWRAWDFRMDDHTGREVGRITKTWEGLLTTMFTTADKYAVQLDPSLAEPLKSLCIAAALTVDTALKQDSRGFG